MGYNIEWESLGIDANNVNAWNNKGDALRDLDRYTESIECYDKALEIDEKNISAWYGKGLALAIMGP